MSLRENYAPNTRLKTSQRSDKMQYSKFNGILKEIIEQYPNVDVAVFLQERLGLPLDKAEELAARIEKECNLKAVGEAKPNLERTSKEKTEEPQLPPKASVYSVENLSGKEFERFMKWLFEELGYEIQSGKSAVDSGVDYVALKDEEKILIHAIKYPITVKAPNAIIVKSNEAKLTYGCNRSIVVVTAYFTQPATLEALNSGVELWDRDTLIEKIAEVRKNAEIEEQSCFPPYKGSLLQSILRLEETKDFIIEPRADGKYDLHLPGVKYPLLTFQARGEDVTLCIFRIKFNEPVGEFDGEALIWCDRNNDRFGPDGMEAYALTIQYLEQFVE